MSSYMEWNKENVVNLLRKIGRSMKGRRIQQEMSQVDLANKSGVSRISIARFESGHGNISLQNLLLLMKALDMVAELKLVFREPEASPSMLAKATTQKTRSRVRKSHATSNIDNIEKEAWQWGDDKK